MTTTRLFVASAVSVALLASACSSDGGQTSVSTTSPATTTTTNLLVAATTTTSPTTTTIAGTKDYEVVAGIFATAESAQAQIDRLTAAKFEGFSIKTLTDQFAVVLFDITKAEATSLVDLITKAGIGAPYVFHLIDPTATNFEVVDGIYLTSAQAQAQIDKLTAAKFLGFSIKEVDGKFAVVLFDLTSAEASLLVTAIDAAGLGPSRVKELL